MTYGTRSRAACGPPAFPPKIVKPYLATPIIRWRAITPAPTWAACCNRRTSCSIEAARRPYCAWLMVTRDRLWESNSDEEDLVLRAKCMNRDASAGTGG